MESLSAIASRCMCDLGFNRFQLSSSGQCGRWYLDNISIACINCTYPDSASFCGKNLQYNVAFHVIRNAGILVEFLSTAQKGT